jgi:hypothetical protein
LVKLRKPRAISAGGFDDAVDRFGRSVRGAEGIEVGPVATSLTERC